MQNKCFNCLYFFSCKRADENTINCDKFEPRSTKQSEGNR